jgi:glyoxylase I family protein
MKLNSVQHIGFNCLDMRKQVAFYTKHFGLKPARVLNRGKPGEFIMLRLGGVCMEFFQTDKTKVGDAKAGEQSVGFKHLAFEVPDIEASVAALNADGVKTGKINDCSAAVPGLRVCFFNDPEGNVIELMQGWQDE